MTLAEYKRTAAAYQRLYSFISARSRKIDAEPNDFDNALADLETLRQAASDCAACAAQITQEAQP